MFIAEDKSMGLADSVKCLSASEVVSVDFMADTGEVPAEETSPVVL